jgi:hypothetical protein
VWQFKKLRKCQKKKCQFFFFFFFSSEFFLFLTRILASFALTNVGIQGAEYDINTSRDHFAEHGNRNIRFFGVGVRGKRNAVWRAVGRENHSAFTKRRIQRHRHPAGADAPTRDAIAEYVKDIYSDFAAWQPRRGCQGRNEQQPTTNAEHSLLLKKQNKKT